MFGDNALCARCAAEHETEQCEREHVPNVEGATGKCLGTRCVRERAPEGPLPVLCRLSDPSKWRPKF